MDISNIDLPMKLKRRRNKRHHSHGGHALHKKHLGNSIEQRPKEIDRHPNWFKSITFDNGSEFADMTKIKGCQIYFAHPYSPWERGTNENCNGLLRQFFPKGKSMKDKSKAYVQQATNAINHKYRRILQYHTAEELFKQYISS